MWCKQISGTPHTRCSAVIGLDGFSPAKHVINGFNTRPICEMNTFVKWIELQALCHGHQSWLYLSWKKLSWFDQSHCKCFCVLKGVLLLPIQSKNQNNLHRSHKNYFIDLNTKTSIPSYVRILTQLLGKLIVLLIWTKQSLTFTVQTNACPAPVHVRIHASVLWSVERHSVLHLVPECDRSRC